MGYAPLHNRDKSPGRPKQHSPDGTPRSLGTGTCRPGAVHGRLETK